MEIRVSMRQDLNGRWTAQTAGEPPKTASGPTREACLDAIQANLGLRGDAPVLVVDVLPRLAGVAEAAAVMGWDKRRVVTYLDRGRFPRPFQALASGRIWLREDVERFAEEWRARRVQALSRMHERRAELRARSGQPGGPAS